MLSYSCFWRGISTQAGTTCGASSQPDLIKNHFLIARMLGFLQHSRQKVPYFNILRQKVTYFNVLWQKVRNFNVLQQREGNTEMKFFLSLILSRAPYPHSLSISSQFPHFLSISSSFPHSLSISSQPGCKAATTSAALHLHPTLEWTVKFPRVVLCQVKFP